MAKINGIIIFKSIEMNNLKCDNHNEKYFDIVNLQ